MAVLSAIGIAIILALVSYGVYRLNYRIGYAIGFMSVLFTLMMINVIYQAEVHGHECDWLRNCEEASAVMVDSIVIIPANNPAARTCFGDSFTIAKTIGMICSAETESVISRYGKLIYYDMVLYYEGKKMILKLTKDTGDIGIVVNYRVNGAELLRVKMNEFYFVLNDGTIISH